MTSTTNIIIGAGPAGLAMAGRLRKAGLPFIILEKSTQIAAAWQNHYDRLHLHTTKQYSQLPHLPFPDDFPTYIPRKKLVEFYEHYAQHFSIEPLFEQAVISVKKEGNKWQVKTQKGELFQAENVIICTSFNRKTYTPNFLGKADFKGEQMHSRFYKNGAAYKDKKVLVVGMGNTGAEIALDLLEYGAKPSISIRGAVNIVPRDFLGNPTQQSAVLLDKLPYAISDWLGKKVRDIAIGDLSKYGIPTPQIPPAKQLREQAKAPVLDIGTVAEIKKGTIKIMPEIKQFGAHEIEFKNNEKHAFDAVIFATGYRAAIEDFLEDTTNIFNKHHIPKNMVANAPHEGLYFLGFGIYSAGMLWGICQDSEVILKKIKAT